jgi:hypothetical protein
MHVSGRVQGACSCMLGAGSGAAASPTPPAPASHKWIATAHAPPARARASSCTLPPLGARGPPRMHGAALGTGLWQRPRRQRGRPRQPRRAKLTPHCPLAAPQDRTQSNRQECPSCNGTGYEPCACRRWNDGDVGCSSCNKTGYMTCRSCGGGGTAVPIPLAIRKHDPPRQQ